MSRFFHSRLNGIDPYVPGEQPQTKPYLKLNTNESPFPPSPHAVRAAAAEAARLHLYPDPTCHDLLAAFADALDVGINEVFVSNGSDEVLAFCFQGLCPNGVAFADLTYGFYPVFAELYGVPADRIALREDYSIDIRDYGTDDRTVVIANPNAPTGLALSVGDIKSLLQSNPNRLVIIDEAYVAFGTESAISLLHHYDNLLVIGTLSKSHGFAGARLGYAAAHPDIIADLNRIKFSFNPYNVNRMTLAAGVAALQDHAYFVTCRDRIIAGRIKLLEQLRLRGFFCTDSKANFVFATHPDYSAPAIYTQLRALGVLVRWFDVPRARDYLRITIGTDAEIDSLLVALDRVIKLA